jgi:hypothetical protein
MTAGETKMMQEQEFKEEEEMFKKALEISKQMEELKKMEYDEEEEMIRRVMEISEREEKERMDRSKRDTEE